MKKKFTILITAAFMLLTMMATTGEMWGQTRTEVTDVMNRDWTGVTGTSYSEVTGLEGSASSAIYTAQCAGGNSSIQLRSNNNTSGIVSTASGGTVTKVVVTWNSNTTTGRTLNVYGKNTAYSAASDLYGNNAGTLIGTIVCGTSTELTISDSYSYIGMRSASGAMYLTKIDVTWETGGGSTTPSITANNVEIDYDSDGDEIEYTIDNPVSGGELTASTTSDWLTLGDDFTSPIAFTCTTNTAAASRTATVTLTYTYSAKETVTKNVTVTQTGNPNAVDNISDITATGTYTVQGTIVAISNRGFILGDGTGYVYYYYGSSGFTPSNYAIGDKKKLAGAVTVYGGVYQFGNSTTITSVETSNYQTENPTVLTGADMDARVASTTPPQLSNYIQYVGTLTVSGTYYNITNINEANTAIGSISYPINTDFTSLNGKQVTVTGYYVGISSSTYYNTMIGSIEEVITDDPSIDANNVEITYDTDAGVIEYTINNPVGDGVLTASTTSEWLTLGDVEETIPFTCSTNTAAASRTATVTLTYTYNTNQTVTKNVTVTQTGNPNIFDNIQDITEVGTAYSVKGTVVAVNNKGFIMGDGTGYVYTYLNAAPTVAVGDMITVSGTTGSYGHIIQFTNTATIAEATSSNYDGTPEVTVITEVPDYTEGYHLATYLQFEGGLTKSGSNYLVSVGASQIRISYPTTDQGNELAALENKTVRVHGFFSGISGSGTSAVFTATMESVEEVISSTPVINADNVNIAYDAISGEIAYTISNPDGTSTLGATTTADWVSNIAVTDDKVTFTTTTNEGTEDRVATFTLTYTSAENKVVTVTQGHFVVDYADLPFEWAGNTSTPTGITNNGVGTYSSAPYLKFDSTGDYIILKINERPGTLTFDIKGNSFSDGTFKVQTSEDGTTYTDLETYTELGNVQSESFNNLGENVRYIKWIYTEKVNGNVALGNITLAAYAAPVAAITVDPATVNVTAEGEDDGILAIEYENLTITDPADFDIQYYNANNEPLDKDHQPEWMQASVQANSNQDGYEVSYSVDSNDGDARTAYFKVYALDGNFELVYSNLITVSQDAYVAPVATIAVTPETVNITAAGQNDGSLTIAYENLTITDPADFDIQYFDANNQPLEKDDEPDWMEASIIANSTQDGYVVSFSVDPNDGEARTAYFKVFAMGNQDFVYSNLVTINQAAYVVDYATLPFEWAGGPRSEFEALNGTSTFGVGDYNNEATHKMKLDGTGDYIQIKTNEQPGIVTIGVKMVGGASTSYITVQGSADGETFTNVDTLTISGKQNDVLTLETTYDFAATDRYVRLYFTKGSNVGVGPITIAKHVVKYAVNLNQPQNNEGTIAADKETAAEGETVTLTATPSTGYTFGSWTVLDGDAQEVTVTNNAFVMPASDVEVEATFTALDKHIIVIPVAIENNVIVDVTNNQAYANETVTITVDAPDNKVLATLTVTGNTSSNNITIAPEVSPYVDEYTFTMPDEDVTINATFDDAPSFTVSFSVNGSVDASLEVSVSQGQSTALPTSSTLTPEGFSITGWAATNGSAEAVADPYTPNADITLYAILGQTIPHSLVITASTPNFPTSYGTANTFTEYNLGGKNFKIQQGFINGGKLQWRAAGNNNGTGTMYNSEDLGKINTIILVYDESDTKKNFTIKAGTTENPTEGTSIEPSTNGLVYTFDLSQGNYKYFVMTNGENAGYLQSIAIDYVADLNVNTIAHIATSTTYTTDIPATTCVIVDSGAVLTLNGTNNGTPDNLIIEDGGQLIHNDPVSATMRMTVSGYGRGGSGYKFIASPVSGSINVGSTNLTDGSYDLYIFDQSKAGEEWRNYKASAFTTIDNGKGYLYAHNPTTTIEFAGELQPSNVNVDVDLAYTAEKPFSGVNLVGNPFACNAYVNTAYYVMNTTGDNYVAKTTADAIPPCNGILVGATAASQKVTFSKNAPSANPGQGNLNIQVAQVVNSRDAQQAIDNAIISFGSNNTLQKFSFRDDNTKIYFTQGNKDYAVVNATAQGEMPVNFKAAENGTYTIDFSMENVEFSYLHMIDNKTGMDIDLLQNPSYTFEANKKDYASRFRLVFSANSNENDNDNENFGFISNGNLMILGIEGQATIQLIDVTGRIISTESFSGSYNKAVNATPGVYMIRLIQGENVRTQKIVVR